MHKKITILGSIPLVIIAVIISFSLIVQAEHRYKGTFNTNDSLRFQSPFKGNDKGEVPFSILVNPEHPQIITPIMQDYQLISQAKSTCPWICYSLSATQWDWTVRKPGDYAAKCLVGTIRSNVDVVIHFEGFEDLSSTNSPTQNLETYYSATILDLPIDQLQWHRASDFNGHDLIIPQNPTDPTYWSLWNKISVQNNISADEYEDDAFIDFLMQNNDTWTDPKIMIGR